MEKCDVLNKEDIRKIVTLLLKALEKRCAEQMDIQLSVTNAVKDFIADKLDLISIANFPLKIYPLSYKISSKKLNMTYYIFNGEHDNISIYKDNYSIISQDENISLEININKGIDKDNNTILFYNMSKVIPLKFNDSLLEKNIHSLFEKV